MSSDAKKMSGAPSSLRDVVLTNKKYHNSIVRTMERLEKHGGHATIRQMIAAQRNLGNTDYVNAFPHYLTTIEQPFNESANKEHELVHLTGRLGHVMQHEMLGLLFEQGYMTPIGHSSDPGFIRRWIDNMSSNYKRGAAHWQTLPLDDASKKGMAIYFAASMYLREKVEVYRECVDVFTRTHGKPLSYEAQKQLVNLCSGDDLSSPTKERMWGEDDITDIMDAPYQLIQLSEEAKTLVREPSKRDPYKHVMKLRKERVMHNRQEIQKKKENPDYHDQPKRNDMHGRGEWASIEAVATGLCEPEDTDYPNRLRAIKTALVETGLFYDTRKEKEQRSR